MTTLPAPISRCLAFIPTIVLLLTLGSERTWAADVLLDDTAPSLSGRLTRGSDWPQGSTVVLLHGTLAHRDMEIIQSLEELFSDYGFNTLAINLSLSVDARDTALPCSAPHRHQESDAAKELARWMRWLRSEGADDITLLGHSRGANQSLRYTLTAADSPVDRLILVAPPRWTPEDSRDGYRARHRADLDTLLNQAEQQLADGRGAEPLPLPVGLLYCEQADVSAASFVSYYRDDPLRDTPTALAEVQLPTLVITGSEDTVVRDAGAAIAQLAPDIPVEEIEGADHFFRDLYADELVDIAVEFIEDTP